MIKNKALTRAAIALGVSAFWGAFADLPRGQVGWFVLRVVLATGITYLASLWFDRHDKD